MTMTHRKLFLITLTLQIVFCGGISAFGGIESVNFVIFGICQWIPGVVALSCDGEFREKVGAYLRIRVNKHIWLGAISGIALILSSVALTNWFGVRTDSLDASFLQNYRLAELIPAARWSWPIHIAFLVVAAPALHVLNAALEEFMWRGALLDRLLAGGNERRAIVISGIYWGLWHVPMVLMLGWVFPTHPGVGALTFAVALTTWGMALAVLRLRSGSLWPPVITHAVLNAWIIGYHDVLLPNQMSLLWGPWGLYGALFGLLFYHGLNRSSDLPKAGVAS